MKESVEIGRATQDELRDDLNALFRGAIRLTLEMVLEEELKAMVGASSAWAAARTTGTGRT